MSFVTNRPITIPAGSEVRLAQFEGMDCYEIMHDDGCMRIFVGRQASRDSGFISPKRATLKAV
jgi:hypothetical protein